MFQFDPNLLPSLRTRKALLIIDLQEDFVSPDGALPVTSPEGFVQRTVEVADAFRASGDGDVIWIRSVFEKHRSIENEQILTSDMPLLASMRSEAARGRRLGLGRVGVVDRPEDDDEAFLSLAGVENDGNTGDREGENGEEGGRRKEAAKHKPECVRPSTKGIELANEIAAVVDKERDAVLTKTHYSAFQSGRLLQLLRGRFATEVYVCGVLTNISIHATALDAAKHGIATTLVDDCCGYRNETRHTNAVRNLTKLTGCETTTAEEMISIFGPKAKAAQAAAEGPKMAPFPTTTAQQRPAPAARAVASVAPGPARTGSSPKGQFVRDAGEEERPDSSRLLPEAFRKLSLNGPSSAAAAKSNTPQPPANKQPVRPLALPAARRPECSSGREDKKCGSSSDGNKPEDPSANDNASLGSSNSNSGSPDVELEPELRAEPSHGSPNEASGQPSLGGSANAEEHARSRTDTPKGVSQDTSDDSVVKETTDQPTAKDKSGARAKRIDRQSSYTKQGNRDTPDASPKEDVNDSTSSDEDADDAPIAKMEEGIKHPTPSEPLCEGDTTIFHDVLPESLEVGVFERLRDEVTWLRMSHQGGEVPRLVSVQGEVDEKDGTMPVYRHPADESPPLVPFTPTVLKIKAEVEKLLGHPLNHVLIQFYRSGNDYISEHSDKTLDIVKGSFIANVSLGAERTMVFRTKRPDKDPSRKTSATTATAMGTKAVADGDSANSGSDSQAQNRNQDLAEEDSTKRKIVRARLPHNSLCRMGLKTNERWLHAIRQDKRMDRDKTPKELAFSGGRISLTFRRIGTFLDRGGTVIWGQGATSRTRKGARAVVNGQTEEAVRMLKAFGTENHSSAFDWDAVYGAGFDVLHMNASPRFFASEADSVANTRVKLMLAEYGVAYAKGVMGEGMETRASGGTVRFVDNDSARSTAEGDIAVMLYLERVYGTSSTPATAAAGVSSSQPAFAKKLTRLQQALHLGKTWESQSVNLRAATAKATGEDGGRSTATDGASSKVGLILKSLARELALFEAHLSESATEAEDIKSSTAAIFIAGGDSASIADFALWPVLHDIAVVSAGAGGNEAFIAGLRQAGYGKLARYYNSFRGRKCIKQVLGPGPV